MANTIFFDGNVLSTHHGVDGGQQTRVVPVRAQHRQSVQLLVMMAIQSAVLSVLLLGRSVAAGWSSVTTCSLARQTRLA
jgi:hypothetical protein